MIVSAVESQSTAGPIATSATTTDSSDPIHIARQPSVAIDTETATATNPTLLSEVESIKLERVRRLETVKQELEQHLASLDSLRQYAETLLSSGTAGDVTRSADSLHSTAEELATSDVIGHVDSALTSPIVSFIPSTHVDDENVVGTVFEGGWSLLESISGTTVRLVRIFIPSGLYVFCMVKYEMLGLAAKYGLSDVREGLSVIRDSVWSCFVQKVQL